MYNTTLNKKNFYFITIILLISAIVSFLLYRTRFETVARIKISNFPKTIGEWASEDIPISERDYKLLETRNLILRNYKNQKGDTVNLYIVYSEDNRKTTHPPEICLQGEGATITEKSPVQIINSIKATMIIIEDRLSRQMVVYWYKAGSLNTDSYLKQQLKVVYDRILGKKTSVSLIRLLTSIEGNRQELALNKITTFCKLLEPLLIEYVPQ